jgi:outer membrane protein assembly factor BamB
MSAPHTGSAPTAGPQVILRRVLPLIVLLFVVARSDWINHGGNPARNGLSDQVGPAEPVRRWAGSLNSSFGEPVFIEQDRLVTCRYDFNLGPIVCHDLTTGETLWTRDFPGNSYRSWPIGLRDGQVYAVDLKTASTDTLYALDVADGHIVWRCPYTVQVYLSESATFTPNGDLILTLSGFKTARINHLTGDTVWTVNRVWPISGSADLTVAGDRFYGFGGALVGGSLKLQSFDLATGRRIDSVLIDDTHPGGTAPYGNIIVGPDGVLYAHRCGDNVTAVEDRGESLHVRWVHEVSGADPYYAPWAQLACGPDSSVYALSSGRVIRLDPLTGAARDSSEMIQDTTTVFQAHLSVGADGTVYAANGGFAHGALCCLTPDLRILWVESIPGVNISCPAIGPHGELAIAGGGDLLRVYEPASGLASRDTAEGQRMSAWPNPFTGTTLLRLPVRFKPGARIAIYDALGRLVRHFPVPCRQHSIGYSLIWDGRDGFGMPVPPGIYVCRAGAVQIRLAKVE